MITTRAPDGANKVHILPSGLVGLVTVCRVGRLTGVLTGGEAPSYNHCQSKSFMEIIAPFLKNVGGRKSSSCNHSSKSKSSAATSVAKKPTHVHQQRNYTNKAL